jgi:hypothetical protein
VGKPWSQRWSRNSTRPPGTADHHTPPATRRERSTTCENANNATPRDTADKRPHGSSSLDQSALAECWAGEVSGLAYYEALAERFPEHRDEAGVLALVETVTRDLIEGVARTYDVSIDHDAAERIGVDVAQSGSDWGEVLENALAFTPHTLRMFENLADVLPESESALGQAVVEHERAQITLYESVVAGRAGDWSAIDGFLERHGTARIRNAPCRSRAVVLSARSADRRVVAHGQFTTLGGGKTYHFLTQPLGVTVQPFPDGHVHFHWTINCVTASYTATRDPGC